MPSLLVQLPSLDSMASDTAQDNDFYGFDMEDCLVSNPSDSVNREVGAGTGAPLNKTLASHGQGNVIIIKPNSRELLCS